VEKDRPPSDEKFREKIAAVQSGPAVKTDPETAAAIREALAEEGEDITFEEVRTQLNS
jgi:hypothetical protein